jgi:hypothetical protein
MNTEEIIEMARQAWISDKEAQLITEFDEAYLSCTYLTDLTAFAKLVAAKEREECVRRAHIALLGTLESTAGRVIHAIQTRGET